MKTYKYKITGFLIILLSALTMNSCDVLQQASQMANLSKCEFKLQSVNQLTLAGINVQNIHKYSDLTLKDAARTWPVATVASGQFPLDFTLNIEAKNPNTAAASTKLDAILLIDGIEMTKGIVSQQVTIPANNGIAVIPMKMSVDLKNKPFPAKALMLL